MSRRPTTKTRGKTQPGRTRLLDDYLGHRVLAEAPRSPQLLDIGIGENGVTSWEWLCRSRVFRADARLLGLELAAHRVERARTTFELPGLRFLQGDFRRAPELTGAVWVVRAFNLLRQFAVDEVAEAHRQLVGFLQPGGLAVDATSSKHGERLAALLLRAGKAGDAQRMGLLFASNGADGFAPMQFRDVLPRDLRRQVKPGTQIHGFFQVWTDAWAATRHASRHPLDAMRRSAAELHRRCEAIDFDPAGWRRGLVVWRPEGGVWRGGG